MNDFPLCKYHTMDNEQSYGIYHLLILCSVKYLGSPRFIVSTDHPMIDRTKIICLPKSSKPPPRKTPARTYGITRLASLQKTIPCKCLFSGSCFPLNTTGSYEIVLDIQIYRYRHIWIYRNIDIDIKRYKNK